MLTMADSKTLGNQHVERSPDGLRPGITEDLLGTRLEAQEKAALQRTLAEANGNLTRAADLFGVPRTTYREKLVRHGLLEA